MSSEEVMWEGSGELDVPESSVASYAEPGGLSPTQVRVLKIAFDHGAVDHFHRLGGNKLNRSSINSLASRGLLRPMWNQHCDECNRWFAPITGAGREVMRRLLKRVTMEEREQT